MRLAISAVIVLACATGIILSQVEDIETEQVAGGQSTSMRVVAVQPRSRIIDWRLSPQEVLREVDRTLEEFTAFVGRAGSDGCDLLVFPEDTLGILHWEMGNQARLAEVLPEAVRRMLERPGKAARSNQLYLACCTLGGAVTGGNPDRENDDLNLATFRTRAVDNFLYLVCRKGEKAL